jgi:DNA-3-methyladenine glycosylase II
LQYAITTRMTAGLRDGRAHMTPDPEKGAMAERFTRLPVEDAEVAAYAPRGLDGGIAALAGEPVFAAILEQAGPPRFRRRRNGFATLLHIILEQQVSIDAAAAMHRRLSALCRPLAPEAFLALDDATLRACGFSRQKMGYARHLATKVVAGEFDFSRLAEADDQAAQAALIALKGIGRWSAEIYLIFVLGRPDIWPAADLGLQIAVGQRLGLASRPPEPELRRIGEAWRPWRSVAACLFWQSYLHDRGRAPPVLAAELYA